ncbi:MAG: hypothetical protein ABIH23_05495 [bacterium]
MDFAEYYHSRFRDDLRSVLVALPAIHDIPGGPFLQPQTISTENTAILAWENEHRDNFAVALFFTVLVDQVFYTYYREDYHRFRRLTLYPKWKGNCPSGCYYHIHPSIVFGAIAAPPGPINRIPLGNGIQRLHEPEVLATLEREVKEFFSVHMPEIDGDEFWQKCVEEFPKTDVIRL